MPRTIRRQPFDVPTSSNSYSKSNLFTSVEFKGLCDSKNDVTVDPSTFADVKNVYVDDAGQLTSRPPFKFDDGGSHILQQWLFGAYGLRLQRRLCYVDGGEIKYVDDLSEFPSAELQFIFTLYCTTHETIADGTNRLSNISLTMPVSSIGFDYEPKVTCALIEDKIFIWFAGIDFFALNLTGVTDDDGNKYLYFENAVKYLYFPIHKLIINGIESDFETKNFLTDAYRRRYQYSTASSIDFEKLVGKTLDVSLTGPLAQDTSKFLYSVEAQEHQDKMLLYPYSSVGNNYHIDIVQTSRATVILRYSYVTQSIEVSFDGKYFRPLPSLVNIIGTPLLTRDGFYAVAFTPNGVAQYKLVAQETEDFIDTKELFWEIHPYMRNAIHDGYPAALKEIDTSFRPVAYFETIDQFAYIFTGPSVYSDITENLQYVYAEWLNGSGGVVNGWYRLSVKNPDTQRYMPRIPNDDTRLHFRYVAPTSAHPTLGPTIIIATSVFYDLVDGVLGSLKNGAVMLWFEIDKTDRVLRDGEYIRLENFDTNKTIIDGFAYRVDTTGKYLLNAGASEIINGDMILLADPDIEQNDTVNINVGGKVFNPGGLIPVYYYYQVAVSREIARLLTAQRFVVKADTQLTPLANMTLSPAMGYVSYTREELNLLGDIRVLREFKSNSPLSSTWQPTDTVVTDWGWDQILDKLNVSYLDGAAYSVDNDYTGSLILKGASSPAYVKYYARHNMNISITDGDDVYSGRTLGTSFKQIDLQAFAPSISTDNIEWRYLLAYNMILTSQKDPSVKRSYDIVEEVIRYSFGSATPKSTLFAIQANSQWFKIMPNTSNVLTDKYLWIDEDLITRPQNGELSLQITDIERTIANDNNVVLAIKDDTFSQICDRNIHKLSSDGSFLVSGQIKSGDIVAYTADAFDEEDYIPADEIGHKFVIEKLSIINNNFVVTTGQMKINELVRLRSYDGWEYPAAPANWSVGDSWPSTFPEYRPVYVKADGTLRFWQPGDQLPIGPVVIYGFVELYKTVRPLAIDANGAWYSIDGTLWTSQLSIENTLELDEYVNAPLENGVRQAHTHLIPPDYTATLSEHYFAFSDENYLLEVTETRRDVDKLLSDEGTDFLLYLPQRNEQKFSNRITNLHPLSDTEIGIFTEKEVWYVGIVTNADGTVFYTKPVKSRIPVGCRYGDDVITALDGQALIFPTPRGITALAPQDFIATTEKTLSYLSDNIQEKYRDFYKDGVMSSVFIPNEFEDKYDPQIKIVTYRYWILFYKYYDREILVFDTRNASWWIWTTPYPIRSMTAGLYLHLLMQIDFSPIEGNKGQTPSEIVSPVAKVPLMGVSYILADDNFVGYYDDTIDGALNGLSEQIYENEFVGYRRELRYASPVIDWRFMSQKLHFNQLNNYKAIKGITINVKGTDAFKAKLSTKAFRNLYHPEQSDTVEVNVNDLRTFVERLNIMHVVNFQYKLENDMNADIQQRLKLNSLSIKYEVKEGIR